MVLRMVPTGLQNQLRRKRRTRRKRSLMLKMSQRQKKLFLLKQQKLIYKRITKSQSKNPSHLRQNSLDKISKWRTNR